MRPIWQSNCNWNASNPFKATQQPEASHGLWGYFILDTCRMHKSLPPLCLFLLHCCCFFKKKQQLNLFMLMLHRNNGAENSTCCRRWFAAFVPSFLEQRESEEMIRGK